MRNGVAFASIGVALLVFSGQVLGSWPLLIWSLAVLAVLVWEEDSR